MIDRSEYLELAERVLLLGTIVDCDPGDLFLVRTDGPAGQRDIVAERLVTSEHPIPLHLGDSVLCWVVDGSENKGVILGRVGGTTTPNPASATEEGATDSGDVPDTLVLEAKQSLTLRVGDGSITIRADGKILIKGKDLVSHAKNVNRIKGGAVAIN
jgi:hypothetical protein